MKSAKKFGFCIIVLSTLAMAQTIATIEQPLVPSSAQPGGAAFTLTINGAGFVPTPTGVLFGGTQLTITNSTATQLTVTVPPSSIAASGTASVSVLSGEGLASNVEFFQIATPSSPQFAAPVDYPVGGQGTTISIQSVLVADFNGDGILDLAVGFLYPAVGPQLSILLGNGDGTFQSAVTYKVDDATSLVAGVFNTEGGSLDLVAGDTLLVNDGSGVFTPNTLDFEGFRPFAVGDFSQTGVLDIAGVVGANVQILTNDGAGDFSSGQSFTGNTTQFGGMLAADFNGDGILDLAVLDTYPMDPVVRVFLGAVGTAGFGAGNPLTTNTPAGVVAFTAADFNGDNQQDLALVSNPAAGGGEVSILNGNGDGTFGIGSTVQLANTVNAAIVSADFNEDGKLDLATGTYILQGDGDGTFQAPISFGGNSEVLATGDFNNDGRPDLVAEALSDIAILLQQAPTTGAPIASLSPTTLNFNGEAVGSSVSQPVTLTNTGTALLDIDSIAITGPDAEEFSQKNTCGTSLAANASCTITVTFTPTDIGNATASVSITDNAAGSPQTVPLPAAGAPFSLTTTCTSLTVVPGQSAIFTVDLAAAPDFTPTVVLSCSGAPALATCTVAQTSMNLNGPTPVSVQVTATTTQATGFLRPPFGRSNENRLAESIGLGGIAGLAALVILPGKRRNKSGRVKPGRHESGRRLFSLIVFLGILATVATLPSCGGVSDPPGTAAGIYPLTVTGTFQQSAGPPITETVSFNLVVQ